MEVDNSDMPETAESDRKKDKIYVGNPKFVQDMSHQFKEIALGSDIREDHINLFVKFMKLATNEKAVITDTTRLIDYISDPEIVKFFAKKFNERLEQLLTAA